MKLQFKLKWLGNWVALLVLSILAAEGLHSATADIDASAMQITLAIFCSWLAILLSPVNTQHKTQAGAVLLWAVMAAAGFLTLSSSPLYFEQGNRSLQLAGGVLVLVLLFSAMQCQIRFYSSSDANCMIFFTLIAGGFFAAPLYLSAVAEATSHQALVDVIIAASPVSYLAGIADYDYLRSNWFYQYTPFGGLRFNYPATGVMTVCYLTTTLVLAGANTLKTKAELRTLKDTKLMKTLISVSVLSLSLLMGPLAFAAEADEKMDAVLQEKAGRAVDAGLHFLRLGQSEAGSWSNSVGITALALRGFLESPRGYNEDDGAFITRSVKFLLDHINDDGSISETNQNRSYNTAVAIVALQATGNPAYQEVITNAQKFLTQLQIDSGEGYEPEHKYYGGIGYGGDERPDMANQYLALEALSKSHLSKDDPVWEKAQLFISRSQNRSESNDQEWAGNDGGFIYAPGFSPHGNTESYGGITHAGLISLLFAGVDKTDPRVQAAHDWIRGNYTLDENPGSPDNQGLFFYYNAFAKSMSAFGESTVTDTNGIAHNWRNDLATKLISLQRADGSWVNDKSTRWWEANPDLCTARSVIALNQALNP